MSKAVSPRQPRRRCPACGSYIPLNAAVCEICGHESGTTQAIPRTRMAGRSTGFPWGVIGVAAVMLVLVGGGLALWPYVSGRLAESERPLPTAEVILNPALLPVTPPAEALLAFPAQTPTLAELVATPQPSPTPLPPLEHVVEQGDTCSSIALRYSVSLAQLIRVNRLDPSSCLIRVGDKLIIPRPTPTPQPTITYPPGVTPPPTNTPLPTPTRPAEILYTVQSGETCSEIALKFSVPLSELIAQNNLDSECVIRVGQQLRLVFATPTPIPTLTPFILQTPTPRSSYAAPVLIAPLEGSIIVDQPFVTLRWSAVGFLQPDEWYVVQVQPSGASQVPLFQTKATSLKLTTDLLEGLPEREITWWVQVRRRKQGADVADVSTFTPLSPPSTAHRFTWRQSLTTPTP